MIVVIPMAGEGRRFVDHYSLPKPLVAIRNKPMIQWCVESLALPQAHHVFVVRQEHLERYALADCLRQQAAQVTIVPVQETTQGAACSVLEGLRAAGLPDEELVISNCDQWLEWDSARFLDAMRAEEVQGGIPVFRSTHPKWSYAKVDGTQYVTEVAEKRPISPWATCGVYWWQSSHQFVAAARAMLAAGKKVNGEYYVAPTYNELIAWGGTVGVYNRLRMYGLGTPEDLEEFRISVCSGRIPE